MKNKYKLKKWYPSLSKDIKVGDIAVESNDILSGILLPKYEIGDAIITEDEVRDNPEFWEEVVERKYKILSFKRDNHTTLANIQKNGRYMYADMYTYDTDGCPLDDILGSPRWNIYSIERISDGKKFTIGDKVKWDWGSSYKYLTIRRFYIDKNGVLCIDTFEPSAQGFFLTGHFDLIDRIEHYTAPLFRTHDGVDIYEGDKYYFVETGSMKIHDIPKAGRISGKRNDAVYFSTEETATDYVHYYKLRFSKQDVINIVNESLHPVTATASRRDIMIQLGKYE